MTEYYTGHVEPCMHVQIEITLSTINNVKIIDNDILTNNNNNNNSNNNNNHNNHDFLFFLQRYDRPIYNYRPIYIYMAGPVILTALRCPFK